MHKRILFLDIDGVLNNSQHATEWGRIRAAQRAAGEAVCDHFSDEWHLSQLDPENIKQLEHIIEAVPDTRIVISSTWRILNTETEIKRWIAAAGAPKASAAITGKTGRDPKGHRGTEIEGWLRFAADLGQTVTNFVILDDDSDMTDDQKANHFIHTDGMVGLTAEDVARAIQILTR